MARLHAAAQGGETICIELSSSTDSYAWDKVHCSVPRFTCLQNEPSRNVSYMRISQKVGQLIRRFNPRCVAINGWWDNGAIAALEHCNISKIPAVVMSESQSTDGKRNAFKEAIKRSIVSGFSAGLVGGKSHAQYLAHLGMPKKAIFRGYDCVDNDFFETECARLRKNSAELRLDLNLPKPFFLASARFIAKKNFVRFVEAYAHYRKAVDEPWDLVLLGDGEERTEIEGVIARYEISSAVHLPGFLQLHQLTSYYALAEAFVLPSTHEQWGLVLNEAMACGLPVLASSECGSTREMIRNNENGLVFDPFDLYQMMDCLVRIHKEPEQAIRMGQEGQKTVQQFGPKQFKTGIWKAVEAAEHTGPKPISWGLRGMENLYRLRGNIPGKQIT